MNRPLRIALAHYLRGGGAKRTLYELAVGLGRRGHLMDVYHINDSDDVYLSLDSLVRSSISHPFESRRLSSLRRTYSNRYFPRLFEKIGWPRGVDRIARFVVLLEQVYNLYRFDMLSREIAREIDSGDYDLVFLSPFWGFQSPNIIRHLKTTSVYICHEQIRNATEFLPRKKPLLPWRTHNTGPFSRAEQLKWLILNYNDRRNVRSADLVLANSYFSRESLYRWYGIDAGVLRLGVDTDKFYPLDMPRKNFVLSVGALSSIKAHDFLIDCLSLLPPGKRPALVVAGAFGIPGEREFLEKYAAERGVQLIVEMDISDERLVELYNTARVTLCASIMEPFGLISLESQACATPVLAVNEGGFRETIKDGENGILATRDSNKFAQALLRLLDDETMRNQMGERARREVLQNWGWERTIDSLEKFFYQLLNKKAPDSGLRTSGRVA